MNNFSHGNGQVTSKILGYIVTGGMQLLTRSATAWLMRDIGLAQEFLARGNLHEHFWRKKKILNILLSSLSLPGPSAVSAWYFSSILCPSLLLISSLLRRNFYDPFPLHLGKEEVFPSHLTTLHSILGKKKTHSLGWFNLSITGKICFKHPMSPWQTGRKSILVMPMP